MPVATPREAPVLKVPGLVRCRVEGSYLVGADVHFSRGGVTIIGEHGAGKSTLLAFMRFGLDVPVPLASAAAHEALLEKNLGTGRVFITIETPADGLLTFSRALTRPKDKTDVPHDPPRFEPAHSRPGPPVAWSPDLCPVHFSGHGELTLLATDGKTRLALVERFAGPELRQTRTELARVRAELDANAKEVLRVEAAIDSLAQATAPLAVEAARLAQIKADAGADPVDLEAANASKVLRDRERTMLERARQAVDAVSDEVARLVTVSVGRIEVCVDPEVLRGPNAALLESVGPDLAAIAAALQELGGTVSGLCDRARASFAERATTLAAVHSRQEDDYRALLGTHEHDSSRALERVRLESRVAELSRQRDELGTRVQERAQIEAARGRLRERQASLVAAERAIMKGVAERLTEATNGTVVVEMDQDVDKSAFEALLVDMAKGRRFEAEQLTKLAKGLAPADLFHMIVGRDPSVIARHMGSTATAERFIAVVRERRRLYDLETVPVGDLPAMYLVHGTETKRHDQLSSGQRIATFVRIMLLDRRGPFIADTPENDVSGQHLATVLCPALAELGEHGQYIIVSHNGNLPILGGAHQVIELSSPDGTCGVVKEAGAPKAVLVPMENHLEGGHDAFVKRREFYDGSPS